MKGAVRALRARISPAILLTGALASLSASALPHGRMTALWIAESEGILNVAADTGEIAFALERDLGAAAVAVNDVNGEAWVYGKKKLAHYGRAGEGLLDIAVPASTHGGDPVDMVVDGTAGNVWLAIGREVYRFDFAGLLQQTLILPRAAVALALDRSRSLLWIASAGEVRLYDADGTVRRVLTAAAGDRIADLAHDPVRGVTWVSLTRALRRYDGAGTLLSQTDGAFVGAIAADGAGGLWLARGFELLHFDELGTQDFRATPFTEPPDQQIVDLVADPHDASVWVASQRRVRHIAIDGERLADIRPDLGGAHIRRLHRASLYADLDKPELTIAAPADGSLMNDARPAFELRYFDLGVGVDPSSIAFSVGAERLPVTCDAGPAQARCAPSNPLPEGANAIGATVADFAGNVSEHARVTITIDTVPPELPDAGRIHVAEPDGGRVRITGSPGSVEAGSTVRISNRRTGQTVTVVAGPDGSFDAQIEAEPGDALAIAAVDAASNIGAVLESIVPEAAGIVIEEPLDGATIEHETVLVVGTYHGPLNAAITVGGRPATVLTEAGVVRFYATAPLQPGDNTITATVLLQNGKSTSRTIRVRRESGAFAVKLTPQLGSRPLAVRLTVTGNLGFYDNIRVDFNGDGLWDGFGGAGFSGFFASYRYNNPGLYRPRTEVHRYNFAKGRYEVIFSHVARAAVIDPALLEQHTDRILRSVWAGMQSALVAANVQGALTAVSGDSQIVYREVFESLLPQLPAIFEDFTDIEPLAIADNYAEYVIMNVRGGRARVHVVSFVRGADGLWRIDSM